MNKPPIVEIVWRDAFGRSAWHDIPDHEDDYIIHTVGYLLWEDKHYMGTGACVGFEEATTSNTMSVPKKSIMSIKFLRGKR